MAGCCCRRREAKGKTPSAAMAALVTRVGIAMGAVWRIPLMGGTVSLRLGRAYRRNCEGEEG
jgi:hypothetical protein